MSDSTVERFRVWPIDIDVFRHMNNAKYLNYMEAARWGFTYRSGFLGVAMRKGWIFPIRAAHVEYYRELKNFQRFEIRTQFVRADEKWYYIVQQFFSDDKEMARGLIVGTVRKGRENIPPSLYLAELGFPNTPPMLSEDITKWLERLKL